MVKSVFVCSYGTLEHALGHLRFGAPLKKAGIRVTWHQPTEDLLPQHVETHDLVIVQRDFPRALEQYARLVEFASRYGKPIVFEFDDFLWGLPDDHPDRLSGHYLDALWPMLLAALQADAVTVSTPALQAFMRSLGHPHVYCLPNYLDDGLWPLAEPEDGESASIVRIGYVGGDSHAPDVQLVAPALERVLRQYRSDVQLTFWGVEPPAFLREYPNVIWNPAGFQNYAEFVEYLGHQNLDIFLAPLRDVPFNRFKSAIKYLECTALGAAGICSDVTPYRDVVEHGRTGFLAHTAEDWEQGLRTLIEDRQLRLDCARRAQEAVRQRWVLSEHYQEWDACYEDILKSYRSRSSAEVFRLADRIQMQYLAKYQGELDALKQKNSELHAQLASTHSSPLAWGLRRLRKLWRL